MLGPLMCYTALSTASGFQVCVLLLCVCAGCAVSGQLHWSIYSQGTLTTPYLLLVHLQYQS